MRPLAVLPVVAMLAACSSPPGRELGVRAPLTATCDDNDPVRCVLPWPSSRFLTADASTSTGVRLELDPSAVPFPDDTSSLARADGFSRVTPLVTAFTGKLDAATVSGALRLVALTNDGALLDDVPLEARIIENGDESFVFALPRRPLRPATDYVAIVTDTLRLAAGGAPTPSRDTLLATGSDSPETPAEQALSAYHAPTRTALAAAGVKPSAVVRVWDFVTRSLDQPTRRLSAMRDATLAAVIAGTAKVVIDAMEPRSAPLAMIVSGRLTGLPSFAVDDASTTPVGTHDAPFRLVVPAGTGDYRLVMYGHGTGANVDDDSFDDALGAHGWGKLGVRFSGWTGDDIVATVGAFTRPFEGTGRSSARLMQSLADALALEQAARKALGDAVSGEKIGTANNPTAGRRPNVSIPVWTGGSLGGCMGFVYSNAHLSMSRAVLNVPGAAWTHFLPQSSVFDSFSSIFAAQFGSTADFMLAFSMTQTNWDDIDGSVWVDAVPRARAFLLQESVGDPVLPNVGTRMVAASLGATLVGKPIEEIPGMARSGDVLDGGTGLTQFRTDETGPVAIHGFAARNRPAGAAARAQIEAYLESVFAGAPRIVVPPACAASGKGGTCDFAP